MNNKAQIEMVPVVETVEKQYEESKLEATAKKLVMLDVAERTFVDRYAGLGLLVKAAPAHAQQS
jgi:hypothetical protein